jgi:hypothetical protein
MKKKYFTIASALIMVGTLVSVPAENNLKDLPGVGRIVNTTAANQSPVSNNAVAAPDRTAINGETSGYKASKTEPNDGNPVQQPISKTAEAFAVTPELKSIPEAMNGATTFAGAAAFLAEAKTNKAEAARIFPFVWAENPSFENPPPALSRARSESLAPQAMPTPSLTIEGISGTDVYNIYNNALAPPSMVGDAGLNHYVQAVNHDLFRIYDKATGAPVTGITRMSTLFSGFPLNNICRRNGDVFFTPRWELMVNYDPPADRWIISRFGADRDICIAVSQTGDPTGSWYIYHFKMPENRAAQRSLIGVWTDGYYFSTRECVPGVCDTHTNGFFAFNREKMISGDATANFVYFSRPASSDSMPLPADIDGYAPPPAAVPQTFFEMDADEFGAGRTDSLLSYEFVPNYANPASSTLTAKPAVPVAAFDARYHNIEQPPNTLDSMLFSQGGALMYRVAYRNLGSVGNPVNSYVMNWTVNVSGVAPTSSAAYQAAPRWTELRRDGAGALSVFDQGTHAPDPDPTPPETRGNAGRNRWLGSIAQDNQGNLALGFSRSGPKTGQFADIVWAGRTGGQTAAGVMNEGEATMHASTGVQRTSEWGWYSVMSVDPADDCTFWYNNEYRTAENEQTSPLPFFRWNTRIGKFKFPSCAAAPKGQIAANVTYCGTGAPANNARVAANAGNFIRTTAANGNLISNIIAAPGNYTVSAVKDNLLPASTAAANATVVNGSVTHVNLCLNGVDVDATTAAITSESCAINNAADPGETMTVNLGLKIVEGNPTSNLTATLLPTGGVTSPSAPQNYGSLNTNGTPTTRSFTFTVAQNVIPETNITLTLALTDGSSNLGTVTYKIPVGRKDLPGQSFDYTGDTVVIPAQEERTIPLNVSGVTGTIQDLDFVITEKAASPSNFPGIAHTRIGELELNLTSPQGTTVRLMYFMNGITGINGGCISDNIVNTTLDDSATVSIDDACPGESETSGPLTGRFKPDSPLSAFNGENPNGTWTLRVTDYVATHFGALHAYRLVFKPFEPETCSGGGNCAQAPSGMVGWYPGEGSADDISPVTNNGTLMNGATFATGMVGQAFSFDGVNDFVQMPSNAAQDPTTTATLDAWVKFNQTPSQAGRHMEFISKGSFGSDFDLGAPTDDKFYLYISGGLNVGSTTVIQPDVWYHVAGTWDATGLKMYVNGVLENTNSTPNITRTAQPTRPLTIGNGSEFDRNQRWFSGLIDEAEIFNRALSASEIQAIFNAGGAGKCKPGTGSGLEADVAYRTTGDASIFSNDVVQVRRFLNTADTPNPNTNEFQRADSAPFNTKGDGAIQANDVVQARRYLNTADPVQTAGGPTAPTANRESIAATPDTGKSQAETPEGDPRRLYVESTATSAGQMVTVNIRVDSQFGDEAEYGFAVNYDPAVLISSNPPAIGTGNAGAAIRDCVVNPVGRINCSVGAFPNNNPASSNMGIGEISPGTNQILITVTFTVAANASPGITNVTLSNVNASNDAAQSLSISSQNGTVTINAPTAATVTVGGRVLSGTGRGIARAQVALTDGKGERRIAVTNQFGYFRFEEVRAGESYIFEVKAKRYRFADNPRVLFIGGDYGELNFTASP